MSTGGQIAQVAGTNTPSPPVVTTSSGITCNGYIAVAAAQSNGAAESLIVDSGGALPMVDITTTPFTTTVLANSSDLDRAPREGTVDWFICHCWASAAAFSKFPRWIRQCDCPSKSLRRRPVS